jgi:hypothetical protein
VGPPPPPRGGGGPPARRPPPPKPLSSFRRFLIANGINPTERVFAEVRQWVEGRRYERIEAKKVAVEAVLRWLEAEGKVSSLVGRPYIRQALNALPS